ncbi:ArsR family transcriptional regulator [Halobaculum rubrum]|uniref:ArsR family transcriptional regulator n=1 Tax=Halobaculum rubrum TaxID=2872158 RepID=UPI0031F2DDAC
MDFSILDALVDGRNVAANLHMTLDVSRPYVNSRLGQMADYGLVRRIGPNENAGLYEITERGRAALELRDEYEDADDFDAVIDAYLDDED